MNTLKTIDEAIEALGNFAENPKGLDNYSCHINITTKEKCGRCSRAIAAFEAEKDLKALRKQWDYERQNFEKLELMGDEELFKIEFRVMSQMLNDEKNEGDLRLARLILRLHKAEKTLETLRNKLGSEEFVEGMEAQDILNRCINLNDYIYREDPEYYGDYYVTLFNELHRLKAAIKAMGV